MSICPNIASKPIQLSRIHVLTGGSSSAILNAFYYCYCLISPQYFLRAQAMLPKFRRLVKQISTGFKGNTTLRLKHSLMVQNCILDSYFNLCAIFCPQTQSIFAMQKLIF